jgi:acyl carrier protein
MDAQMAAVIEQRSELIGRLKRVLIDSLELELEPDDITEDAALFGTGLGLDSIDALVLIVGIEDEFDVSVPPDAVQIYRSVNTIADFLIAENGDGAGR